MSGGFFRGTSADQDTRFSNKQAKLMKSQKFAPELDHLVDMAKVQMDVIRPWIAARATELLGFEDEVLINFVYGLLEGKEVDGKHVQIQLTGFMEKNTGKFMKELWGLLLSAQNNTSGVPQQFLDAKEEEMRKKKGESDRITQEIQKRKEKEGREVERVKDSRMDGDTRTSRFTDAVSGSIPKQPVSRASSVISDEERKVDTRSDRRTKSRFSRSSRSPIAPPSRDRSPSPRRSRSPIAPPSKERSSSPPRDMPPTTRSMSNSFSKSRSYSEERDKSRSSSISSQSKRQSVSPGKRYRSPRKRSITPERRHRSPPRGGSISPRRHSPRNARSPSRRRSRRSASRSRRRSPPPYRWRSPRAHRISPPPKHRRSPSPSHHRSPTPPRRRSPVRRRSPSPLRRRSPVSRISRSPLRRKSPSRASPRQRRRSRSPRNRATDSQLSPRLRKRTRSPYRSRSPRRTRRSVSRERDRRANGVEESKSYRMMHEKRSPLRRHLDKEVSERPDSRQLTTSLRSPQRGMRDQRDISNKVPDAPPEKSPNPAVSHHKKNKRSPSLSGSPVKQNREPMARHVSQDSSREEESTRSREDVHDRTESVFNKSKEKSADKDIKNFHANYKRPEEYSPYKSEENGSPAPRSRLVKPETRNVHEKRDVDLTGEHVQRVSSSVGENGPGRIKGEKYSTVYAHGSELLNKKHARDSSLLEGKDYNSQILKPSSVDGNRANDEKHGNKESRFEKELATNSKSKFDKTNLLSTVDSGSEETDTDKLQNLEKRKHKNSDKHKKDTDDDSGSDSEVDDKKDGKRRKEDKRLRKEERRRRREERRRRKMERRASKLKVKSVATVAPPSDIKNNIIDTDRSDGDITARKDAHLSDSDEPVTEQKKLEIELRKKALESLRAKKAI